jgi:hypothetical protein
VNVPFPCTVYRQGRGETVKETVKETVQVNVPGLRI